jgi:ribosomal protein S18 acetylase RimI-like enzyme
MIRPFTDADVDAAAELLAERHQRHLEAEPLLPRDVDLRAEVRNAFGMDSANGVAAYGGYLLGFSRPEPAWGPNVWIETAGHAAHDSELIRDLYAEAAACWIERGLKAHHVLVPATDASLVDAWFRLGFGAQQAHGIADVRETAWPAGTRVAEEGDVDALAELAPYLNRHQQLAPVFGPAAHWTDEELRADILDDFARGDVGSIVAELHGRIVGNFVVAPIDLASMHTGLARPPGAAYLAFAVTHPDARGSGAGVALTQATFAWAHERGYRTMVTDWRVTNLLSSRFWPRRGFRTSFLRLHRLIA